MQSSQMGGFTGVDGHPIGVVKRQIMEGWWTEAEGDGNFYNSISSISDLEKKWSNFMSKKPDFAKVYLLFSEEFDKRENDSKYTGFKGLNPKLVGDIVRKAHDAGLRVSAHIETATDFHNAITAGVDEISHTPGFRGDPMLNHRADASDYDRFLISDADANLAAQKGVYIATTMSGVEQLPFFVSMKWRVKGVHQKNLQTLKKAKANIAVGSDSFDNNSISELEYLQETDIFTNLELLKMICETTPATIFPKRKIGRLTEGYEASFIVLKNNPIKDIDAIKEIKMRVKQGNVLSEITQSNK